MPPRIILKAKSNIGTQRKSCHMMSYDVICDIWGGGQCHMWCHMTFVHVACDFSRVACDIMWCHFDVIWHHISKPFWTSYPLDGIRMSHVMSYDVILRSHDMTFLVWWRCAGWQCAPSPPVKWSRAGLFMLCIKHISCIYNTMAVTHANPVYMSHVMSYDTKMTSYDVTCDFWVALKCHIWCHMTLFNVACYSESAL